MRYPIAIETGDAKHAFGVVVPDLPGCFSAGDTLDDALTNSREAILLHLEGLLDDGKPFPTASSIDQLRKKRSYRGWTWAVVDVDASELGDKAARINITLPQRMPGNRAKPDPGFSPARRWTPCASQHNLQSTLTGSAQANCRSSYRHKAALIPVASMLRFRIPSVCACW
jgi:predicted RNase H-like HicB family nuclease